MNKPIFAILLAGILVTSILAQESYGENSKCSVDCVAPTLGTLDDGKVIVEKGLTINDKSFDISGFSQTIPTQTLNVGQPVTVKLIVNENSGVSSLRYVSFAITDYKGERDQTEKARIAFVQDFEGTQKLEVLDFDKILSNVKYNATQVDSFNTVIYFTFDFAKPVDTSAIIIETWDDERSSRKNILTDAVQVVDKSMEKIKEEKMMEKKMTEKKSSAKAQEEKNEKKSEKKSESKKKPMISKGKKKNKLSRQYQ